MTPSPHFNLPVQMLLAGWGDDYKKEFFLGHSTISCHLMCLMSL